ncbi:DEAD/DEAH box helicase [Candidatus Phytoplasma asteris]|uniref:DEAD/DEAH box helicase n=1 Tax=Candidatus Phytoplasma asteris TaxID=85620 RepID=A0ABZ3CD24_9MOLU
MQNYIKKKILQLQFQTLTPIQKEVFSQFEKPGNLVGIAPTGTGKTHAYLLPILSKIDFQKPFTQAIILVPTNDLVFQVWEMFKQIEKTNFTKILYGGMDKQKAIATFEKKQPPLIIATPDKLLEYAFKLKKINLKYVSYLVLDEADMMFDEVFLTSLDPLINHLKAKILLFSATITEQLKPFINRYFGKSTFIDVYKQSNLNRTFYLLETTTSRMQTLIHLTKVLNPYLALVFVNEKKEQELVFQTLQNDSLKLLNYNSALSVKQRKQSLKAIHKLKYQYVIASDLAARGIDFDASCVIHYNLPSHLEFFFHRSGRTSRMGKKGEIIVLYDPQDIKQKDKINKLIQLGITFHQASLNKDGFIRTQNYKTITTTKTDKPNKNNKNTKNIQKNQNNQTNQKNNYNQSSQSSQKQFFKQNKFTKESKLPKKENNKDYTLETPNKTQNTVQETNNNKKTKSKQVKPNYKKKNQKENQSPKSKSTFLQTKFKPKAKYKSQKPSKK